MMASAQVYWATAMTPGDYPISLSWPYTDGSIESTELRKSGDGKIVGRFELNGKPLDRGNKLECGSVIVFHVETITGHPEPVDARVEVSHGQTRCVP